MKLDLTPEEVKELVRILETFLADSRVEVRRTEAHQYHDRLVAEGNLVRGILDRLRQGTA